LGISAVDSSTIDEGALSLRVALPDTLEAHLSLWERFDFSSSHPRLESGLWYTPKLLDTEPMNELVLQNLEGVLQSQ
jgi:hypothetical protein